MTKLGIEEYPDMDKTWLERTPIGRVGQPKEAGFVAAFLASDAASLMTGVIVVVDGG